MSEPGGIEAPQYPRPPKRWALITAALGAGVGSGLLGTSLHSHAWYVGTGPTVIPYGAALALLLVVAVALYVGLWSKNAWVCVLCGAGAYITAGALSLQLGSVGIITGNVQGSVWIYGIAIMSPVAAWLAWAVLRSQRK
ncbi:MULTISPECIES: hypothetical protein [Arthrobacter]|uniref:hypothetical protein n=1 Tax=Arthrobacter TaxID=1663 RepID=UPI0033920E8B